MDPGKPEPLGIVEPQNHWGGKRPLRSSSPGASHHVSQKNLSSSASSMFSEPFTGHFLRCGPWFFLSHPCPCMDSSSSTIFASLHPTNYSLTISQFSSNTTSLIKRPLQRPDTKITPQENTGGWSSKSAKTKTKNYRFCKSEQLFIPGDSLILSMEFAREELCSFKVCDTPLMTSTNLGEHKPEINHCT